MALRATRMRFGIAPKSIGRQMRREIIELKMQFPSRCTKTKRTKRQNIEPPPYFKVGLTNNIHRLLHCITCSYEKTFSLL